mgnify:FL=1|tara:strand:+ start:311 stop:919 length:609 start_codon:yes stop_codon:yes gene_type:complete
MPKPKPSKKIIRQENLWPTPYWYTTIWEFMRSKTRVTFNEDFTNYILNEAENKESVRKSNRGGWQSELIDPKDENYKPLVDEIFEFVKSINLNVKEMMVTQLWANINRKHDYNVIHQHGSYHLAGTYYVKVPKDSGRIVFRDPRPGAIGNLFMNKNFDNGELKNVNMMEGLLMIWPSYLDHFVEISNSDEERISISFDIVCR